jgi:tyrosyl-tRNA synthetase
VAPRLNSEAGISYTEFSYQVLQGMDYLELFRRYHCTLQTGGSDQWGNLTAGTDLIRKAEGQSVHALGTPLIVKADGTKFGKTETGTVWLDAELTSPYAFYQFWLNADDRDVPNFLRIFSFKSREEIEELERLTVEEPFKRAGQRALAEELTALVHGQEQLDRVVAASKALFGQGDLGGLDEQTLAAAVAELPYAKVDQLGELVDLFVASGLSASRSAARRTVNEGGAYVNNEKVSDEAAVVTASDLLHGRWLLLRRGKRNLAAIELVAN